MCVYQTSGVNIKSQCLYNAEVREQQQQQNTILLDFESGSFLCHIFTSFCLIIDISFFFTGFWRSIECSWVKVIDLVVRKIRAILLMMCGSKRVDDVTFAVAKCCLH